MPPIGLGCVSIRCGRKTDGILRDPARYQHGARLLSVLRNNEKHYAIVMFLMGDFGCNYR